MCSVFLYSLVSKDRGREAVNGSDVPGLLIDQENLDLFKTNSCL